MTQLARTIRTGTYSPGKASEVLASVFASELLSPSSEIWLVSPWITDLTILDNTGGDFDALRPEHPEPLWRLSDVLSALAEEGSAVNVVTRPDKHNESFLNALRRRSPVPPAVYTDSAVHEKTLCGVDWIITGSMNFTVNGLYANDEAVVYSSGRTEPARARLHFTQRWGGGQ